LLILLIQQGTKHSKMKIQIRQNSVPGFSAIADGQAMDWGCLGTFV
jgi:hypothetical protein